MATPAQRRRRWYAASLGVVMVGAGLAVRAATSGGAHPSGRPPCAAATTTATYRLTLEQAANATTIAAVARRDGLPDHAVTVAVATALQESGLVNLPGGDLDSVGLFQQRPSQGWGTRSEISSPIYAAAAFYQRLAQVPGWQGLAVTDAAQAVQRSAAPDAYAQWEPEARVVAEALTGEIPAGFTCRLHVAAATGADAAAARAAGADAELGVSDLAGPLAPPRGWVVANWLVGHAATFGVASVSYDGQRWTAARGTWRPDPSSGDHVAVNPG